MTFMDGDIVRLTGAWWEGDRTPQCGDIVEIVRSGRDGDATFYFRDVAWYVYDNPYHGWGGELVESTEVGEMTRLPRDRKGKTPIDVGVVEQDGLKRVRISMGEDLKPGRKNSDLSVKETEDLIAMLNYNMLVAKGEIT